MSPLLVLFACVATAIAADHTPYRWSADLPKEVPAAGPAAQRSAAEVDALFADRTRRRTLDGLLAALGQPDGFTTQALYSATHGTAKPQRSGGTLMFTLRGGGQLLVRTGDFHVIYEAIRYDRRGRGTLLEK
jgi:hypothetical protein